MATERRCRESATFFAPGASTRPQGAGARTLGESPPARPLVRPGGQSWYRPCTPEQRREARASRTDGLAERSVDGSTACQAVERCTRILPLARDLVLDFRAVRRVEAFGLEVLARGLREVRAGRIRFRASPGLLRRLQSTEAERERSGPDPTAPPT